ncbi:MAG: O-antigen ligase family protein, partial [Nitrospiraceae bacterium]
GFVTLAAVLCLAVVKGTGGGKKMNLVFPVLLMIVAFIVLAPEGYGDRVLSIFDSSKDKAGSSASRMTSMKNSLVLLGENPLFGVGMGMNILAMNQKGMFWQHVHNIYLQIATELGVPALIVFLMLLRRLIVELRRIQSRFIGSVEHSELYLLAVASEISLLAFCVGAMFYPVAYYFYFYYIAGFALALKGIASRISHETEKLQRPLWPWEQRSHSVPWGQNRMGK